MTEKVLKTVFAPENKMKKKIKNAQLRNRRLHRNGIITIQHFSIQ